MVVLLRGRQSLGNPRPRCGARRRVTVMCIHMYIYIYIYIERERSYIYIYIYISIVFIYIYIYICVCSLLLILLRAARAWSRKGDIALRNAIRDMALRGGRGYKAEKVKRCGILLMIVERLHKVTQAMSALLHTVNVHTKNCQTKNLWVKIPKSLR